MEFNTQIGEKIKALAIELTQIRSVVGTTGEIAVAQKIYDYLAQLDYFRQHPDQLRLVPVRDDELGRLNVFALIEGKPSPTQETLLCIGHIDTVGVADYGGLQEMATDPVALKKNLALDTKFSEPALSEIMSDRWLLGRGILDMKTGVAALMVLVEYYARQPEALTGNLVFYAVPDEEGNSAGMLSAVEDLAALQTERGWHYIAAIDTDFMTFRYPGDENRYVYVGTTGKLLPCFYIYGEETHVGEPFNGLDANLLLRRCCNGLTSIRKFVTSPMARLPCRRSVCISATIRPSIRYRQRIPSICTSTIRPIAANQPRCWQNAASRRQKHSRL